jgi:maleamate amidohydrolase
MTANNPQALQADYQKSGFGRSLGFGTSQALLMVDFAHAYFAPGSPLFADSDATRIVAASALEAARRAGLPVIHTRVEYDADGTNGGVFYRKIAALEVFRAGSPLGDFAQGLAPQRGEQVITKQYASGFFGTPLASTLTSLGIDCDIIAGMSTSGCVRATAVDAIQHGFIPVVLADAVGDRNPAPHEANLFDLQAKYADVVPSSVFIEHCAKRAKLRRA